MERSTRQEAVELIFNQRLNTRRDELDWLKAILHRCIMRGEGPEAVNAGHRANLFSHLLGRIQHVAQRNDTGRDKQVRLFKKQFEHHALNIDEEISNPLGS